MARFMEGDPRYAAIGDLTPRLVGPKQTGVFLGGQRYDPNQSMAGQMNNQFLAPSEMGNTPAGSVTFAGGVPQSAPAFVNQLDQAQQRAQFLGNAQWTGGGAAGNAVGRARQAATDAIQRQSAGAAARYGIARSADSNVPYNESQLDELARGQARNVGGSKENRARALAGVNQDISMRNARRDAMTMAEQQLGADVEKARYGAEAMANKVSAQSAGRRDVELIKLAGTMAKIGSQRDIAKDANAVRMAIAQSNNAQDAASTALKVLGDQGMQIRDPKTGQLTPEAKAYQEYAIGQFGQTDQGIQQTQVKEAPGIASFDADQSGDIDTPEEVDAAQAFMTKVMTKFNGMTPENQEKQKLTKQYILAQAIQQRLKKKANDEATRLVQ